MATVYRAQHVVTGQYAAVKLLAQHADFNARRRFAEEVKVAASIGHPGVVQVFDAGVDPEAGDPFLAMELLSGQTLGDCMEEPERDPRTLLFHIRRMLEPLAAAHEARIVHRDLKPENIFVSDDLRQQVKLLDFGIARGDGTPQLTQTGSAVGTPNYMSPEQALGQEISAATDVWAVGVMLYEILAGEHPYRADNAHGVIVAACTRPHEPLRSKAPDTDPLLSELVDSCLEKEASRRPKNAGLLLVELNRVMGLGSVPPSRRASQVSLGPMAQSMPSGRFSAPRVSRGFDTGASPSLHEALSFKRPPSLWGFEVGLGSAALRVTLPVVILLSMSWLALLLFPAQPWFAGGLLAIVVASVVLFARNSRGGARRTLLPQLRNQSLPAVEAAPESEAPPSLGPEDAVVSMVLVADLSCPRTRKAKSVVDRLLETFPSQLRVVFRHAPSGLLAYRVSEAALEARAQGGDEAFWRFLELLSRGYKRVTPERIEFFFDQLDLKVPPLRHAWKCQRHWLTVDDDRELAQTLGIRTTPSFLIGGRVFERDIPVAVLADAVEALLQPPKQPEDVGTLVEDFSTLTGREFDQVLVKWSALEGAKLEVARSRDDAMDRANRLLQRAQGEGGDFEKLAATFSDGFAYIASITDLPLPVQRHAARLRQGAISPVVESEQGFHILHRRG